MPVQYNSSVPRGAKLVRVWRCGQLRPRLGRDVAAHRHAHRQSFVAFQAPDPALVETLPLIATPLTLRPDRRRIPQRAFMLRPSAIVYRMVDADDCATQCRQSSASFTKLSGRTSVSTVMDS